MLLLVLICGAMSIATGHAEYVIPIIAIIVLYLALALGCKIWNMADDIKDIRDILAKEKSQTESTK